MEAIFSVRKASIFIASLTLLSRMVGLVRDRLLASKFGSAELIAQLDTYNAAFRVPDLIFNILILGTLSAALVPVLSGLIKQDKEKAVRVASTIFNLTFLVMGAICIIFFFLGGPITHLIAPGFSDAQTAETIGLSRIIILAQLIFALSNVATNTLVSLKKFIIANLAPAIYNIGIIAGIVIFYPRFGLVGLAYGVVAGALMHLLIQIPELIRHGFSWKPALSLGDPTVRRIGKLFWPRLFAIDTSYTLPIIATIIGSTLAAGSISVFIFANNIQSVPIGIFALSTAIAAFPLLSEKAGNREFGEYSIELARAVRQILFFIIPLSLLTLLFRAHIVRLLLGSGNFDWPQTISTFKVLGAFTFSLFSQALIPLFSRAFYALHDTKTPVVFTILSVIVNATLSLFLARQYGIVGVTFGFTIASIFQASLLFFFLRRRILEHGASHELVHEFDKRVSVSVTKILASSIVMGIVSYGALYLIEPLVNTRTVIGLLVQVAIAAGLGVIVYFIIARRFGLEEAADISKLIFRR